jgi:CobQ-like glutamine amidotransferase family enzyme
MQAKNAAYAEINNKGMLSQSEIELEDEDSISRNLISAYLIGSHLASNLVMTDLYLPRTLKKKNSGQSGLKRK